MRKPRTKPRRVLSIAQLIPNAMTLAAMCAGLTAIRFTVQGKPELAVLLLLVAAILDGLDGSVARLMKSESALGGELDSLADFLNFGAAPALMIYFWTLQDLRGVGWAAALVFAVCCVLRLARFNVDNKAEVTSAEKKGFVGVPAPGGALLALLPMFLVFANPDLFPLSGWAVSGYLVLVGWLMISKIPTWAFKSLAIRREHSKYFFVAFVILLGALLRYPWMTLVVIDLGYLVSIVWSWRRARRLLRRKQ